MIANPCRALAAALLLSVPVVLPAATPAPTEPDDVRAVLEMLRSDVNNTKISTLNQVMRLTAPEAEKFWPIYRQYETDLGGLADRKLDLIREFAAHHRNGTLNDQNAQDMTKRWLDLAQDRLDLWKSYQRKIARAVSPVRAAQFLQVEHQMALFIDLNIAAEMPMIGSAPKP